MTTFAGFDVLTVQPIKVSDASDAFDRQTALVANATGRWRVEPHSPIPQVTRSFLWRLRSRADITALEAFLAARQGRAVPCWVPSWRAAFTVLARDAGTWVPLRVQGTNYADEAIWQRPGRRHWAVISPTGTMVGPYDTYDAVNNGDGTQTITLITNDALPSLVGWMMCPVFLARLASDTVSVLWERPDVGTATLPFVDLPPDTPL